MSADIEDIGGFFPFSKPTENTSIISLEYEKRVQKFKKKKKNRIFNRHTSLFQYQPRGFLFQLYGRGYR